jgi:riboflavin-specific deaminase-like protein
MLDEAGAWQALLDLRRRVRDGAGERLPPPHAGGTGIALEAPRPAALEAVLDRPATPAAAMLIALYGPYCLRPPGQGFRVAHLGQSLDGRIATASGDSRWVTGDADLLHAHRMRALADAVVVGAGTVRQDDPQLTVRRCSGTHPVRVVIDPGLRLGPEHRLFQDGMAPTLVIAAADADLPPGRRLGAAEIVPVPRGDPDPSPGRAPGLGAAAISAALAGRGLHFLYLEGGGITISRFLAARCLDRLQLTISPLIIGSGRPSIALDEIADLEHGLRPRIRRFDFGDDIMVECIFRE